MNQFLADVLKGLKSSPKYLHSKYFYNKKGDELFQKIMDSEDYYLTNCEMEILREQSEGIVEIVKKEHESLDVVELGAGDATKSIHFLKAMQARASVDKYLPVDISSNIIEMLEKSFSEKIPGLSMQGLNGDYLSMLKKVKDISENFKLVLFLGANIGNIAASDVGKFCSELRSCLNPGDLVLIGFDLKKNPHIISAAYNDRDGYTKKFNLNLLDRINEELEGNFDVSKFQHYPMYDPSTGASKSFLISTEQQTATVCGEEIRFGKDEPIYMEISQKYAVAETDEIAVHAGFIPIGHFFDSKKWFADVLWKCV